MLSAFIWSKLQGAIAPATLFRRRHRRFTTSPRAYTQAACKINKSPPSLDSHCPEVGAANGDKTNGLMGEARAVNHARIHKQALTVVWNRIASFTPTNAVNTLFYPGGTIQGLFALIWGRSRTLLAADGAQLAMKQFNKKKTKNTSSGELQPMTFTCGGWFAQSDKGQRPP